MSIKIDELEVWFINQTLPQSIKLNGLSYINDVPKFVKSHFEYLRANSGNPSFLGYWDRLNELKNILEHKPQTTNHKPQ